MMLLMCVVKNLLFQQAGRRIYAVAESWDRPVLQQRMMNVKAALNVAGKLHLIRRSTHAARKLEYFLVMTIALTCQRIVSVIVIGSVQVATVEVIMVEQLRENVTKEEV